MELPDGPGRERVLDVAGFGHDVIAHTLRHSVATELAHRGAPPLEIAHILGHRMPGLRTTERCIHVMPDHPAAAREALDSLANEIVRVAARPILLSAETKPRGGCVRAPEPSGPTPAAKCRKTGAALGTGERTVSESGVASIPSGVTCPTAANGR